MFYNNWDSYWQKRPEMDDDGRGGKERDSKTMKKFKTESKRLLDLMINSIYTNHEIFLRELISNASDACDRLYLTSLTDTRSNLVRGDFAIRIAFDPESRTVTVSDNGIGMSRDDLDKSLGTIAYSGSLDFKTASGIPAAASGAPAPANGGRAEGGDGEDAPSAAEEGGGADAPSAAEEGGGADSAASIIGQFGVGFYSGFMVASRVKVVSRAWGSDDAWAWESNGVDGYEIKPAMRDGHGTDVVLSLKPDSDDESYGEFLSEYGLRRLVRKYSNYVRYPIKMEVTKSRALPRPQDADDDYKDEYEQYLELETLNSMTPIWKRRKSDVSQEEYDEFYKSDFHDYAAPLATFTLKAEGAISYDALLFIPSHAPFDLYSKDYEKGLALYSSNVMIMEKCGDLLSDHFNFVRGIVDSADLNLNISRETLQQNSQLRAIAKRIEKKLLGEMAGMRDNDRETWEGVFECFGRGIKYAIYTSYGALKDSLADLLLYYSAKQEKMVTLREYLDAAIAAAAAAEGDAAGGPGAAAADAAAGESGGADDAAADGDKDADGAPVKKPAAIYYAAGDSEEILSRMPMVRAVLAKGHDVLLCTQDVDDFCMGAMAQYDGVELKNVAGGELGLETEEEKQLNAEAAKDNEALLTALQEALEGKVSRVAISSRLLDAPSGLSAAGTVTLGMEKVLNAGPEGRDIRAERVLELNSGHAVFAKLVEAQDSGDADKVRLYANLLYNQALLVEGLPIDDPMAFAQAISELMHS
jgi:molecular chaperone HtpG